MNEYKLNENQIVRQIKKEIKKQNISLRELSKRSLVAQSTVYDVLENRGSPRLVTLQYICKALDLEIKVYKKHINLEDDELIRSIAILPESKRKLIQDIVMLLDKYDE